MGNQGQEQAATLDPAGAAAHQSSSEVRSIRDEMFWILPLGLTAAAATTYFLFNRSWGADAAAILSIPASLASAIVTILVERGAFRRQTLRIPTGRRATLRWTALAAAAITLAVAVVWWLQREKDPFAFLSGEVRIGFSGSYAPGWHSENNGIPAGFDVDVARAIQSHFKVSQLTWVDLGGDLNNRIAALRGRWKDRSGREQEPVKLVISNFSMTPARAEQIDFAGPYFVDSQGFLSRTKAATIADIPIGTVCVVNGSTSAERLANYGWKPVMMQSLALCINEYKNKKVDAVSGDQSTLAAYAASTGNSNPIGLDAGAEKYGVGLPNNMPRLCAEVSKVLNDFIMYQWKAAFDTNLKPIGLNEADYTRPASPDRCHQPAPWYED